MILFSPPKKKRRKRKIYKTFGLSVRKAKEENNIKNLHIFT